RSCGRDEECCTQNACRASAYAGRNVAATHRSAECRVPPLENPAYSAESQNDRLSVAVSTRVSWESLSQRSSLCEFRRPRPCHSSCNASEKPDQIRPEYISPFRRANCQACSPAHRPVVCRCQSTWLPGDPARSPDSLL